MNEKRLVKVSRYLSKHLRHRPEKLGLRLEPGGWVGVDDLLEACARHRFPVSREELREVVERNDKRRFAFDPSGTRIRAQQGHSVPVDLGLELLAPPPTLYHGTNEVVLPAILREGLRPMGRHHEVNTLNGLQAQQDCFSRPGSSSGPSSLCAGEGFLGPDSPEPHALTNGGYKVRRRERIRRGFRAAEVRKRGDG